MMDFLKTVPVAEGVIPEGTDTFAEAAFYVSESINDSLFNLLDKAGFVDENAQVVEEAVVTEGFADVKEAVINFLKEIWAKVKTFFENVIGWFKSKVSEAQKFIAQKIAGKKVDSENFAKCPADKKIGKLVLPKDYHINKIKDVYEEFKGVAQDTNRYHMTDAQGGEANAKATITGNIKSVDLSKDMKEQAKALFVSGEAAEHTKGDISAEDFKDMVDAITQFSDKEAIQMAYSETKQMINNAIKTVNGMKDKTSFKNDASENEEIRNTNKAIAKYAATIKAIVNKLTQFNSAVMTLLRERFVSYRKAVFSIAAGAGSSKAKKEEAANSTNEAFSSFAGLLEM